MTGTYQFSNVITGLRAGTQYRIYVQDANGCTGNTALITVGQPAALTSVTTTTPPSCIGLSNGSATIVPASGVIPFTYKYSSAGAYQSSNTFDTLTGGTAFRLYFRDATGCVGVGDYTILPESTNPCTTRLWQQAKTTTERFNRLSVTLSPNPSSHQFTLIAHSANTQPIAMRVMDVTGKTWYQTKGQAEQSFRFGASFVPGIYLVEVRQGNEVKTVKSSEIVVMSYKL